MTISSGAPTKAAPASGPRVGIVLRDPLPRDQLLQVVWTAEETGYECVFVPEIAAREAFSTLAAFASGTSTVGLGTGVVTVQSRSPVTTAMAAATLHELSNGRFTLGIGSGTASRPLDAVAEYVRVVRAILARESVTNERFSVSGFRLGLPLDRPPPIWLAALGDRMLSLAGRIADGVRVELVHAPTRRRGAAHHRLRGGRSGAAWFGRDNRGLRSLVPRGGGPSRL